MAKVHPRGPIKRWKAIAYAVSLKVEKIPLWVVKLALAHVGKCRAPLFVRNVTDGLKGQIEGEFLSMKAWVQHSWKHADRNRSLHDCRKSVPLLYRYYDTRDGLWLGWVLLSIWFNNVSSVNTSSFLEKTITVWFIFNSYVVITSYIYLTNKEHRGSYAWKKIMLLSHGL